MKRKSTPKEGKCPTLKLELLQKLGILAVVNIIPIVICVILLGKWLREEIVMTDVDGLWAALVVIAAAIIYVFSFWMLMPTAKWFKEYTLWQLKHGALIAWAIPSVFAYIMWVITWVFCALAGLSAAAAVVGVVVYVVQIVRD